MVTSRQITKADRPAIADALSKDIFHQGTKVNAFYEKGTLTNVYEDEQGPVFLLRGSRSLRIDMMFFDNGDRERNKATMLAGFQALVAGARAAGFKEITTSTNSPALLQFALLKEKDGGFGFEEVTVNGEVALRRLL
jgi:hypothetical protein